MMLVTPPGTTLNQLAWNPVLNSMLAAVYSNGSMALFMVAAEGNSAPECCTLPPAEGITCVSWSPKGKQLVAGNNLIFQFLFFLVWLLEKWPRCIFRIAFD